MKYEGLCFLIMQYEVIDCLRGRIVRNVSKEWNLELVRKNCIWSLRNKCEKKTGIKEEIVKEYQDDHFALCTCIKLSCCVPKAYTVVYINKQVEKRVPRQTACMWAKSLLLCPTLCDPMDCSPLGSSVHGILQARILEWVAIPSSRGSSGPRNQNHVSNAGDPALADGLFTTSTTWEAHQERLSLFT